MPQRTRLRDSRSWPFDTAAMGAGLALFAVVVMRVVQQGWRDDVTVSVLVGVPLIVILSRFPMVLEGSGGTFIEIGFDSAVLMFLLVTMSPSVAMLVWSMGVVISQATSGKRRSTQFINIGVGILAGAAAAVAFPFVCGPLMVHQYQPRELLAVAAAAAAYFTVDYAVSAVSISIDCRTPLHKSLTQPGSLLAISCFVVLDLVGYLGAIVFRYAPWWPLTGLLVVPMATILVATRALTRGNENARRLAALLQSAVRAQTLFERDEVVDALMGDARELLRLRDVDVRTEPPGPGEIGSLITRGKEAQWLVAGGRVGVRSTTVGDQKALDALAAVASNAFSRMQLTEDLVHYARHDPLTDLPNRGILQDRTTHALQLAQRRGTSLALLFIDLDGFKPVNDRFGHAAGDLVLIEVGERLQRCARSSDTVARLGGDEFAVLFEDIDHDQALALGQRILGEISRGAEVSGTSVQLGASIGIAFRDTESTTETILRHADLAMYEAKARGKGRVVEYDPDMGSSRLAKLDLIDALRQAVRRREIGVVYQPVVDATTSAIVGVEALARWRLGEESVSPDTFITVAEEVGLIADLGEVVLARAAQDALVLREASGQRSMSMSVNVSAQQLRDPRFLGVVRRAVSTMDGIQLVLEITEREGIGDDVVATRAMERITELGVRFAIDDFGVGFSSISYLQDVPAHIIKADRALSKNIDSDQRACLLLRSIATMGRELGMQVVVEGIERESQLELIREQVHAPMAQGYLMHRPMPLHEVAEVMGGRSRAEEATTPASGGRRGSGALATVPAEPELEPAP